MTKRLISLVLALIMVLSMCMTACSTGEQAEEGEAEEGTEEDVQRKNLALTIYAITDEKTTEAGLARVEEKISYYTQAKFKTTVDLRFVTADKYQASLESMYDKFAAEEAEKKKQEEEAKISASIEASKKAQMTKEERQKYEQQKRLEAKEAEEKAEQAAKDEADLIASGKDVATVKDVQMDIIYIPGMAEYYDYVKQGLIIELSSFLAGKFKNINDYVFPSYMTAAAIDGVVYGIPNNQAITTNETYFVVNKALAEKYNVDFSKVKSVTDLNGVYEQIKANEGITPIYGDFEPEGLTYYKDSVVGTMGHTTCAFSDTFPGGRYTAANTYSALKPDSTQSTAVLDYCAAKNYYRKNGLISDTNQNFFLSVQELTEAERLEWEKKGYMTVLYKGADFNTEAALNTGLFGISAHCKEPERAMEVLQLMTTDSGMRNLLAFGVEEEHYIVDAANDNVITIIDDSYTMDFTKSGNALIGYVPDTMDPDYVEKAKAKNLNSHLNPFLGFRFDWSAPENAQWVALAKEWEAYVEPIYAQLRAGTVDNYEEVLQNTYQALYANEDGKFTVSYRDWQTDCDFRNTYKAYTKTLQTLSDFLHVEESEVVSAAE